jgi:hypothetical protein
MEEYRLIDVAPYLKKLRLLQADASDELKLEGPIDVMFLEAMQSQQACSECVDYLFPEHIPVGKEFFKQLREFNRWIGLSESSDEALGLVWAEAVRRLQPEERKRLLNVFANLRGHTFFEHVGSVRVIVRDVILPVAFLADWFLHLAKAVEGDVQSGVWNTIVTLCQHHPVTAIELLELYLSIADDVRRVISSFILGVLREEISSDESAPQFHSIENRLRDSDKLLHRSIYNWSWVTSTARSSIEPDQFSALLRRATSPEDEDDVLCIACRMLSIGSLPSILKSEAIGWVAQRVSSRVSAKAKFYIVQAVYDILRQDKGIVPEEIEWVLKVQPFSIDERQTWYRIGWILSEVLNRDARLFRTLVQKLCKSSAKAIHELLELDELGHLLHDLKGHTVDELTWSLALTRDKDTRRLGLFLLDELSVPPAPKALIKESEIVDRRLLFYESQRVHLQPITVARILASLAVVSSDFDSEFQEELVDELKLQCHNFSGSCREELQRQAGTHPIVQQSLAAVANYFEDLRIARESGIGSMAVPGVRKAAIDYNRRLKQTIAEASKSASPLVSLMKHVKLLYGRTCSHFIEGTLSDAMPLVHLEHSAEMPVVSFSDPEEMALRRLHASTMINRLIGEADSKQEESSEH